MPLEPNGRVAYISRLEEGAALSPECTSPHHCQWQPWQALGGLGFLEQMRAELNAAWAPLTGAPDQLVKLLTPHYQIAKKDPGHWVSSKM